MAELMGICGADGETTTRVLDRMAVNISRCGGLQEDRWQGPGFGLLHFHHGLINAHLQPVANENGTRLAALDGELYDTRAIRDRLAAAAGGRRFRYPDSDAELVLRLFEEQGEAAFAELNGSFAVAIYEPGRGRLLLATDPSFSRPIYYCPQGRGELVFGSRFNALVASGALDGGRLDMTAVMSFFLFDDLHDTRTYYRQARAMEPGGILRFEGGRLTTDRYWRPRYGQSTGGERDRVDQLAEALRRAGRRMTSDRLSKGLMLSGGLDSRAVLAACDGPLKTYTVGDSVNHEVRIARRIARARGCEHQFLRRRPDHYAAMLDEATELTGGMGRFDHCHFLGLLDQVKAECDVLFIEEPADRLLKGYYWQGRRLLLGFRVPLPTAVRFRREALAEQILRLPSNSNYHLAPWRLFREPWRSRFQPVTLAGIRMQLADADTDDLYHLVEHVAHQRAPGRIASFQNVACVRPYLEYRSLGLDRDLLDLAVRMPARYRMGGRVFKKAVRQLNPRLYDIPYANTGMHFDTPEPLAWMFQMAGEARDMIRRRLGLMDPTHTSESWPRRGELIREVPLRQLMQETLFDPACLEPAIFDSGQVRRLFESHMARQANHATLLMSLLSFGRWFRKYGPRAV